MGGDTRAVFFFFFSSKNSSLLKTASALWVIDRAGTLAPHPARSATPPQLVRAHLRQATQLLKPPHEKSGFFSAPSSSTAEVPPGQGWVGRQRRLGGGTAACDGLASVLQAPGPTRAAAEGGRHCTRAGRGAPQHTTTLAATQHAAPLHLCWPWILNAYSERPQAPPSPAAQQPR